MAEENGHWVTMSGVHIFIKDGQSPEEALKEKQIAHSKKEAQQRNSKSNEDVYESIKNLGLKDNLNYKDWERENIDKLRQWVREHREVKNLNAVFKQAWLNQRHDAEVKNLHEIESDPNKSPMETFDDIKYEHIKDSHLAGWFRNADSDYKPNIVTGIFDNHETLNAGMNIAYYMYRYNFERYSTINGKWVPWSGVDQSKKLSFKDWLVTPQTMYRGTHGQSAVDSDIFLSYTPDRKMAESFLNESAGGKLETIQIRPIDTWGVYRDAGEQEYFVPIKWLKENK